MGKLKRFGLVLSATEKDALRKLAEAEGGLSLAAVVRRLIRKEAQRLGLWKANQNAFDDQVNEGEFGHIGCPNREEHP